MAEMDARAFIMKLERGEVAAEEMPPVSRLEKRLLAQLHASMLPGTAARVVRFVRFVPTQTRAARSAEMQLALLQVVVSLQAQAVLRGLGQIAPEHVIEIFEQGFGGPNHKGEPRQHPELLGDRRHPVARQERLLTANHDIHSQADQSRRGEIKDFVE